MRERVFTIEDQITFAELSGDWNPLHMDLVYARRCLGGQAVVHGIHATFWALDSWLESYRKPISIRTLTVSFLRSIPLNTSVTCSIINKGSNRLVAEISRAKSALARLELEWKDGLLPPLAAVQQRLPGKRKARDLCADEIEKASGTLELCLEPEITGKVFPFVGRFISSPEIAILFGASCLVGVECPGLHSLLSELHLSFCGTSTATALEYDVKNLDRRFGLVSLQITAPHMTGTIKAFASPKPQEQVNYSRVSANVKQGEFAGQRALIIGGSRGLGELVAKILTAGGASVRITYFP